MYEGGVNLNLFVKNEFNTVRLSNWNKLVEKKRKKIEINSIWQWLAWVWDLSVLEETNFFFNCQKHVLTVQRDVFFLFW